MFLLFMYKSIPKQTQPPYFYTPARFCSQFANRKQEMVIFLLLRHGQTGFLPGLYSPIEMSYVCVPHLLQGFDSKR